ncbi:MAG: GtrA family protein [Candidatus Woesebacteria bacterium]
MSEDKRSKLRRSFIGRLATSRIGSFSIIGLGLTIFGLPFIPFVKNTWGWSSDSANLAQAIISIVANFVLNYFFTWNDQHLMQFRHHVGRYVIAKCFTLTINAVLFRIALLGFQLVFGSIWWIFTADSFAYLFSTAIITFLNYPIMGTFVFGGGSVRSDARLLFLRLWEWAMLPVRFVRKSPKSDPHKEE